MKRIGELKEKVNKTERAAEAGVQLTEEELDKVAGGVSAYPVQSKTPAQGKTPSPGIIMPEPR